MARFVQIAHHHLPDNETALGATMAQFRGNDGAGTHRVLVNPATRPSELRSRSR